MYAIFFVPKILARAMTDGRAGQSLRFHNCQRQFLTLPSNKIKLVLPNRMTITITRPLPGWQRVMPSRENREE